MVIWIICKNLFAILVSWLHAKIFSVHLTSAREFHHALVSPLTVLKLNLSSLKRDSSAELVDQCLRAVQHIEDQIGGLINPSRSSFNVITAIDEVVRLSMSNRHTVMLVISAKWQHKRISVRGSKVLFQQAIQCLIQNAVHAYEQQSGLAAVLFDMDDQCAHVCVCDMGRGMTYLELRAAQLPQVSWTKGGSGIGIPFAIDVIDRHFQGGVHFLSQRGIGTMVRISIPR